MRLVFWQNCLSPHQLPYIEHLKDDARVDEVIVVAPNNIDDSRKNMGWNEQTTNNSNIQIVIRPTTDVVENILSVRQGNSFHLFSGIRGFAFVFDAFKCSLKYNLNRSIITERPNTFAFGRANGKPLWLHRLRFFVQDYKYVKNINNVFAMGQDAVDYFMSISKKWNVVPFAYCTRENEKIQLQNIDGNVRFVFVGGLSRRKSVISVLKSLKVLKSDTQQFTIVGDGAERQMLEQYVRNNEIKNVEFVGTQSNTAIPEILSNNDVLILPSIYDGWGAVVNEAMLTSAYVICSDRCGAKEMLDNDVRGKVFAGGNESQLAEIMRWCTENIALIRNQRSTRRQWATEHINGEKIAKYMVDCLCGQNVLPPWKKQI